MASKIECPNCKKMLKEEGDASKSAQGEYRVYDSLFNSKHFRIIRCLECEKYFDLKDYLQKELF